MKKTKLNFTAICNKTNERVRFTAHSLKEARHIVINSLDLSQKWTVIYS